jgi:hypothetical protein
MHAANQPNRSVHRVHHQLNEDHPAMVRREHRLQFLRVMNDEGLNLLRAAQ